MLSMGLHKSPLFSSETSSGLIANKIFVCKLWKFSYKEEKLIAPQAIL